MLTNIKDLNLRVYEIRPFRLRVVQITADHFGCAQRGESSNGIALATFVGIVIPALDC